ncbi:hypothetical protein B0H16DRAFT_1475197 [Mycena metata]|uniref:Uncharacterized protein n=1 Tax=Mycena metata TaxID=1033252 RepID=A0AAD7MJC8_9AGAR|nr:hypothetical protein B0H16DRAFT_1475197 [Mycena metata]
MVEDNERTSDMVACLVLSGPASLNPNLIPDLTVLVSPVPLYPGPSSPLASRRKRSASPMMVTLESPLPWRHPFAHPTRLLSSLLRLPPTLRALARSHQTALASPPPPVPPAARRRVHSSGACTPHSSCVSTYRGEFGWLGTYEVKPRRTDPTALRARFEKSKQSEGMMKVGMRVEDVDTSWEGQGYEGEGPRTGKGYTVVRPK